MEVFINGGRIDTKIDVLEWAKKVEKLGAGEILLTSMDRDGTKSGFDLELTSKVADLVSIPVIASGGVGNKQDFLDELKLVEHLLSLLPRSFILKKLPLKM